MRPLTHHCQFATTTIVLANDKTARIILLHANTPIAANTTATNTTFGRYCHVQGIGRFWFMHRDLNTRRTHAYKRIPFA